MTGMPRAYSIGLSPVGDMAMWLAPDARLEPCLAEKDRLMTAVPETVFMAAEDTEAAQEEVWRLLADHLTAAFPETYRSAGETIEIGGGRSVRRQDDEPPLAAAARLVADDLVLMRRRDDGWTLVAASLCFPSFWRLEEKFGRPITEIHKPVPDFSAGTRNAVLVERIFDKLQPSAPVKRSNWSVHTDGALHHREAHSQPVRHGSPEELARLYLRCEYQTLTKLPESGDILFTIRVAADPLDLLRDEPERAESLADRLEEMNSEGLAYKGLTNGPEKLIQHLRTFRQPVSA